MATHNTTAGAPALDHSPVVKDDYEKGAYPNEAEDSSSYTDSIDAQAGVKKIEGISRVWSKKSLIIAYIAIVIIANCTALDQSTLYNYVPYATSAFFAHSLVASVYVVQGCVNAVVKPIMAKVADSFGRLEAFCIIILVYTVGYIQQAASNGVRAYASAQIFYSAGSQGLQLLFQVFAADTSDLLNRAFFSTVFDIPFLWTTWAGAPLAQAMINGPGWRWGYGMWAIILPIVFIPLALVLWANQRKAKKEGLLPASPLRGKGLVGGAKTIWYELDAFGLILLAATICLILIPISLAPNAEGQWSNGSIIAMLVVGGVALIAFIFWEQSPKLAPHAFFPKNLFSNRTALCGCGIGFFYFMAFYLSVFPWFSSYLQIVQGQSITASGHIVQTFSFTSTVASIIISIIIKYTAHYKYFITLGGAVYIIGLGLMIRYRDEGVSTATLVGCQIAVGIGGGLLNVPAQLGVQASTSHQQVAAATAAFLTITEIGGAVGSAISGAVWTSNIPRRLTEYLPAASKDQALFIYSNITLAIDGWPAGSPEKIAINQAYQETMTILVTIACCVAAPIIPLSLLMRNYKLDQMDQKVRGKVIGADNIESTVPVKSENRGGSFLDRFKKSRRTDAAVAVY